MSPFDNKPPEPVTEHTNFILLFGNIALRLACVFGGVGTVYVLILFFIGYHETANGNMKAVAELVFQLVMVRNCAVFFNWWIRGRKKTDGREL